MKGSPFAWPARISEEVTRYPELVDPNLFAQARSYQKHIQSLIAEGHTPEGAAKTLHQQGYKFRGWNKLLITQLLRSRTPEKMPAVPRTLGPKFVSAWNREVLLEKLAESVSRGPFDPVPLPEFYRDIASRAGRFGLGPELLSRMGPTAPQGLSDLIYPPTWSTRATRAGKSILGQLRGTGYKVGGGLAIGLLGLYALKPGSWFSGKDDNYNTIQGLGHSGIGWQSRRQLTDFGSGYRGLVKLPKVLQPLVRGISGYTAPVAESVSLLRQAAGGNTKYLSAISKFEKELSLSPYKHTSWINPLAIREAAEATGGHVSYSEMLRGTIKHERFHQQVVERGLRGKIEKTLDRFVPQEFKKLYPTLNIGKQSMMTEEYFAHAFSFSRAKKPAPITRQLFSPAWNRFSGFDDVWNTIEGLSEKGVASRLRKLFTDFGSGYRGLDLNEDKSISPVEKRFGKFATALEKYGVEAGTAHKRIYIPKDIISEQQLTEELGFVPVNIAIPEAGQSRFESFRHPRVLYHLHEHDKYWTLHEDVHPAASMTVRKWMGQQARGLSVDISSLGKELWAGMQHIVTEGIPGAYYYLRGQLFGSEGMLSRIREEISPQYQKFVNQIRKQKERSESISGRLWSGFSDAYNSIEGLFHGGQAERKRRELTEFGSGWRGLFSKVIRPFTFAGRVERGYKGLIKSSLKAKGISTRGLHFDYVDIMEGGVLDITLLARARDKSLVGSITRSLSPDEVYLTSIEVAKKGAGLGKEIYRREAGVLRRLGYKKGTAVVSSISSPITARWQRQLYGSRPVKTTDEGFLSRLERGQISREEFTDKYAGKYIGQLRFDGFPETGIGPRLRKILTDFGSGWIGTAISRGVSAANIAKGAAALGTGKFSRTQFMGKVEQLLTTKTPEHAIRYIRAAQGRTVGGQRWVYGRHLGRGAFGEARMVYRAGGRAQAGVMKTLHSPHEEPLTQFAQALRRDPAAVPESVVFTPALGRRMKDLMNKGKLTEAGEILEFSRTYMRQIAESMNIHGLSSLQYEARVTRLARETAAEGRFVPKIFAESPKAIVQEVAGQGIGNLPMTKGLARFMENVPGKQFATTSGVVHLDPHMGNIVRRGANYSLIDYGMAIEATSRTLSGRITHLSPAYEKNIELWRKQIQSLEIDKAMKSTVVREEKTKTISRKTVEMETLHRSAQETLWRNATKAGRGHISKSNSTVILK
jgi:tRNA A-37 threonylcarbamoyl transferase component Bud32